MSSYTKSTDFASKDALLTGNPLKVVKGTEIDDEFNALQTAVNSKADTNSPGLTGTPTAPTAATATNTTQIASTAYVKTNITSGGNVTRDGIAADAINGSKIANDSINSEHYVDGSIDNAHLANGVVTNAKLANDAVTGAKIDSGTTISATFSGNLTGNVSGNATTSSSCTGNSATATRLQTSRTIALSGDVSGSTSFDGSGNATITATVADDSHNHVVGNIDGIASYVDGRADARISATVRDNLRTVVGTHAESTTTGSSETTVISDSIDMESSGNRCIVHFSGSANGSGGSAQGFLYRVYRGSTKIYEGIAAHALNNGISQTYAGTILDTPGTSGTVTYSVRLLASSGSSGFNCGGYTQSIVLQSVD